jgi:Glycosyl transferase family 2
MSSAPQRLDTRPLPDTRGECRAFLTVRDEGVRLPYLLDYHRRLGVDRFFINDNRSTDHSREYALSQPDCHVFASDGSFREANQGNGVSTSLQLALMVTLGDGGRQ